jgi:cobalt-zinc-cadmium efflux system membrane fusion protein
MKNSMKNIPALLMLMLLAGCSGGNQEEPGHADEQSHGETAAEFERGPHNGRLLEHEDLAVELAIFERGVPPEWRVWLYEDGKPLPPAAAKVRVLLKRLDGDIDEFDFAPESDFLRGGGVVQEPHSFDVTVTADRGGGKRAEWKFSSHEGRTRIAAATAESMGVKTKPAGPVLLREQLTLSGTVQADPSRVSRVRARYAGVVREVAVQPSSVVAKGAVLAQVQSNESMQNYAVIAPIAGTVVDLRAQVGEATGDEPLFTLIDVSKVWVELDIFQSGLARIDEGQPVALFDLDGVAVAAGRIGRIAPLAVHGSQSVRARVVLDNASGSLRPGQFVTGKVTVAQTQVLLAVERNAIQRFRDFDVVFERVGDQYEVRMLELGRTDATTVEVLGGLKPGAQYVAENSYLIKADIEKSGASHDH